MAIFKCEGKKLHEMYCAPYVCYCKVINNGDCNEFMNFKSIYLGHSMIENFRGNIIQSFYLCSVLLQVKI